MIALYKLGVEIEFFGIKLDRVLIEDDKLEEYKAKGYGSPWEILEQSKSTKKTKFEEIDANDSGALSVEEIRNAAKEAGIEGYEKKRIKTLIKELGVSDGNEPKDNSASI